MSNESPSNESNRPERDLKTQEVLAELSEIATALPDGPVDARVLEGILEKKGMKLGPQARTEEVQHFKLKLSDRIDFLSQKYPQGMKIIDSKHHLRWDGIAWLEMRVIKNHSQPLPSVQRRGGLSLEEILAVLEDTDFNNRSSMSIPEIERTLDEQGFFTD